jgi:hypothetical protein
MSTRIVAGWPTPLDRVDWPAFYRTLAKEADPATLARAEPYTPHGRFALLILADRSWYRLAQRLRAHETGGWALQTVASEQLAQWLQATAHVSLTMLQALASLTEPSVYRPPVEPPPKAEPGLYVDPALRGLPLLDLAYELAAELGGRHHVLSVDLPPGVAGRHTPRLLIELDTHLTGARLDETWLHELGHAFDFNPDGRTPEEREDYAEELGARLADHRPASLQEVAVLCQLTHKAVTARARDRAGTDLPAPGRASIDAFLGLPIEPRKPTTMDRLICR